MTETVWQVTGPLFLFGVAYVLGQVAYRSGVPARAMRRAQRAEPALSKTAFGLLTLTWWGVVLAETGAFGLTALTVPPLLVAGLIRVVVPRRRSAEPRADSNPRSELLLAILLVGAIGAGHFLPAFDVRLEARDPGVYYMSGLKLAKTGSIAYTDQTILELTQEQREYFFPPVGRIGAMESNRYVGFYVENIAAGRVVPQALPVLPVWIGIGYLAAGEAGAERTTALLSVFAILGLFLLTWRVTGSGWGAAAAAVLLSLSFVEAWFARYVAAEIPAQALAMFGLYGLWMHRRYGGSFFALLGAAGLGLMWLSKAETMVLIVPLAVLLVVDVLRGNAKRSLVFWIALSALGVHTLVHAVLFVWPYYFDLLWQVNLRPPEAFKIAAEIAVAYIVLLALIALARRRWPAIARIVVATPTLARAGSYLLAVALATLAATAYWLLPHRFQQGNGTWDSYNLVELGWAVSPVLLAMAVAGMMLLLVQRHTRRGTGAVLGILLFGCVLVLWWRQIQPELLWAYRRWLPLVFPACYLAAAHLASSTRTWLTRSLPRWGPRLSDNSVRITATMVFGLLLVPPFLHHLDHMEPYASHVEMPGVDAVLEEIGSVIEPGSLVLFEPRTRRGLVRFEIPLSLAMDRRVLRIMQPEVDLELLEQLIWSEAARRRPPVYLITTGYLSGLWRPHAELVHTIDYRTRRLIEEATIGRHRQGLAPELPKRSEKLRIRGFIYRLHPGGRLPDLEGGIDLGEAGDQLYLNGRLLRLPELDDEGRTYRWTAAGAGFYLPGLHSGTPAIFIVADEDTPQGLGVSTMTARLDGISLGSHTLSDGWIGYRFEIPPEWEPDATVPPYLELEISPGYRPVDHVPGSRDTRYLGIKIDRISWAGTESRGER